MFVDEKSQRWISHETVCLLGSWLGSLANSSHLVGDHCSHWKIINWTLWRSGGQLLIRYSIFIPTFSPISYSIWISKAKYFLDCLILSSAKQISGEFLPFCYTFYEFKNSANVWIFISFFRHLISIIPNLKGLKSTKFYKSSFWILARKEQK